MTFELWSNASRSIVGAFDTESTALAAVREAIQTHGRTYAEGLALIREDRRGRSTLIAEGSMLGDRALAVAARPDRISA